MRILNLNGGHIALLSDEDYEKAIKIKWCAAFYHRKGKKYIYVRHYDKKKKSLLLHVYLFGEEARNRTIFKDKNTLNFQRENIKIVKFNHED